MPDALNLFLWVASICLIILTVLGAALAVVLIVAAFEVRALARRAHAEVKWLGGMRRHLFYRARFAGKWLRHMGRRFSK